MDDSLVASLLKNCTRYHLARPPSRAANPHINDEEFVRSDSSTELNQSNHSDYCDGEQRQTEGLQGYSISGVPMKEQEA